MHSDEEKVAFIFSLPRKQRISELSKLKASGIIAYNKVEAKKVTPAYQREKYGNVWRKIVCCGSCGKVVGSRGLSKHKKNCLSEHCNEAITIPVSMLEIPVEVDEDFKIHIINKLLNDQVGTCCRADETILKVLSLILFFFFETFFY